jgi:hypothetical protein
MECEDYNPITTKRHASFVNKHMEKSKHFEHNKGESRQDFQVQVHHQNVPHIFQQYLEDVGTSILNVICH